MHFSQLTILSLPVLAAAVNGAAVKRENWDDYKDHKDYKTVYKTD